MDVADCKIHINGLKGKLIVIAAQHGVQPGCARAGDRSVYHARLGNLRTVGGGGIGYDHPSIDIAFSGFDDVHLYLLMTDFGGAVFYAVYLDAG